MRDRVANGNTESEEQHTADDVEGDSKQHVTDDPSIVKRSDDKCKLGDAVDDSADGRE